MEPILLEKRVCFHKSLLSSVLTCSKEGVPSNADKSQATSVQFAKSIYEQIGGKKILFDQLSPQAKGNTFEAEVASYIKSTFLLLDDLRPGKWMIEQIRTRSQFVVGDYCQYSHIKELQKFLKENPLLSAYLGNSYTIAPDVVVARKLESDSELNKRRLLVDDKEALAADIREGEGKCPILHASISCKWTLRSDRAQNSRSEALNLMRNRKGRQPHIIVVTGEPLPSRLASIALGTGDIDCVYHFALYELVKAIEDSHNDEAMNLIRMMINGKRLKDISDLPLDLTV